MPPPPIPPVRPAVLPVIVEFVTFAGAVVEFALNPPPPKVPLSAFPLMVESLRSSWMLSLS